MAADPLAETSPRRRLSRRRVLETAISRADQGGLEALTMRTLAEELGVVPAAIYRHIANKDDLIDAMIDVVFAEIRLPSGGADWATSMRRRATSFLEALTRHRWAIGLMESRGNPGPANLRHHDAVLGKLRSAGFSVSMAARAYSLLDSYIYGFALTKLALPVNSSVVVGQAMLAPLAPNEHPNLVEFIAEHVAQPGDNLVDDFEYGLEIILDGIERARR
ncbi:MAG: TetR/AcrR family transcriptional regulator [Chloroflexota bacterium]|nr:MAG: TetR/AcrR family transcriptional regulator [Chloroflexota bacterium]